MQEEQKNISERKGRVILLLGGARSGKSALAEKLASKFDKVAYIATAEPVDEEMRERIKKHRESRPKEWKTFEVNGSLVASVEEAFPSAEFMETADVVNSADFADADRADHIANAADTGNFRDAVADTVGGADSANHVVYTANAAIIDCLTVYLARRMQYNRSDDELISEVVGAVEAAKTAGKTVIIVSNEVGLGIVPEYQVSRRYRDLLGKANQKVAELADNVYFMVAGIPVDIKKLGSLEIPEIMG
jgi:adenosylcobinamide kinase/adenosylcobinamide-phosphate guanylyltransferase